MVPKFIMNFLRYSFHIYLHRVSRKANKLTKESQAAKSC